MIASREYVKDLITKVLKKYNVNGKCFAGRLYAPDFSDMTYAVENEDGNTVVNGKFDSEGYSDLYLENSGEFNIICDNQTYSFTNNKKTTYDNPIHCYASRTTYSDGHIFYTGENNNIDVISTYVRNSSCSVTMDNTSIKLTNDNGNYTFESSAMIYLMVDITRMNTLYIETSRTSTSGRLYLFALNSDPSTLGSRSLATVNTGEISTYITDAVAQQTNSINVSSLSGTKYIGLANAGSCTTTVTKLYFT